MDIRLISRLSLAVCMLLAGGVALAEAAPLADGDKGDAAEEAAPQVRKGKKGMRARKRGEGEGRKELTEEEREARRA